MADPCTNFLRPSGMGLLIYTSDVTRYDGSNLTCLSFDPETGLNGFIAAVDQAICTLNAAVLNGQVTGANVSYGGDLTFSCFTLTAGNMNSIVEQLATQICSVNTDLLALNGNTMLLGGSAIIESCVSWLPGLTIHEVFENIASVLCTVASDLDDIKAVYVPEETLSRVMNDNDIVYSGANRSLAALFLTMSASVYVIDGASYSKVLTANIALTPTADNYVDYDSVGDSYTVTAVTIGNPAPAIASGSIRLWKFTTDALGVTAESDLRSYGFVNTTLLMTDAVTTAKIANLAVTGAKMETLGVGGTLGNANLFTLVYDTKGRVTGHTFNIDLTGLAAGYLLKYDGAGWVVFNPTYVSGSGTAGRVPRFTAGSTIGDSTIRDNGTVMGINAVVDATIQVNIATTLAYGSYLTSSGANADNYGYYSTVSGGTTNNVAFFGKAVGELASLVPNNSNAGVVGTAVTLNALEAYGGMFGVDGDAASTGKVVAIYGKAINSGSGTAIGLLIEAGGGVFGATTRVASAILELVSTSQGFLPPRMTTAQRDAIAAPAVGLVIYNTTTNKLNVYTGAWEAVTSA